MSGGKLNRTETVTVRLDPRLNYLCELAARAQRRTKSSFIEWCISEALHGYDPQADIDRQDTATRALAARLLGVLDRTQPEAAKQWRAEREAAKSSRDSGRHAQRGDPSGAPSEGCQSGGAEGAASPTLSSSNPETPNDR